MAKRSGTRRVDPVRAALDAVEHAIGEPLTPSAKKKPAKLERAKNEHAVALGRRGGLVGGRARADKLSAEQLSDIGRKAAEARWGRSREGKSESARKSPTKRRQTRNK